MASSSMWSLSSLAGDERRLTALLHAVTSCCCCCCALPRASPPPPPSPASPWFSTWNGADAGRLPLPRPELVVEPPDVEISCHGK